MKRLSLSVVVFCFTTSPLVAQIAVDRALSAGGAVGGPDHLMNEDTIGDVVLPYETATPPESGMSHVQFDDAIRDVREGQDSQGRALRSTEDSNRVRPDVDIDAQGSLFDDANWAHEYADSVAGHYFSSDTGSCQTTALPVTDIVDRFCSASPAEVSETCDLIRRIWVDRWDTYRCDKRAATYVEVCERTNAYACHQANGQFGCLQQNIAFSGGSVTWNDDEATISFDSQVGDARPAGLHPLISHHDFSIAVSDHFAPQEIRLVKLEAGGVTQLLTGSIATQDLEVLETIYDGAGAGIGAGSYCPDDVRSGLVVPTFFDADCRGSHHSYWRVGIYQDYLDAGILDGFRHFYTWSMQWVRGGDDNDYLACRTVRQQRPACTQFQTFGVSANLSRNLLRWMDVPAPTHPVPGAGKKWLDTDFKLRVVGNEGQQHASLTFKFIGTCCDSFVNTGADICQ